MAITDRRVGSVADIAFGSSAVTLTAPTVAQISALTRIECGLVDSIDTPRTGSTTDISGLCSRESYNIAATIENGDITGMAWREFDGTDVYWTLFDDTATPPTNQTLAICRAGFTGAGTPAAPLATDVVDLYTVQVVSRAAVGPAKTDGQRFEFTLAVVGVVFDIAVVA